MARHDFSPLEARFPEVIERMPPVFTSHQFVLALARANQSLYIDALASCRDDAAPFETLHGVLSQSLRKFEADVEHLGDTDSEDLWRNPNRCSLWRKRTGRPESERPAAGADPPATTVPEPPPEPAPADRPFAVRYEHKSADGEPVRPPTVRWDGLWPMRAGEFPADHPCVRNADGFERFKARGYWAGPFRSGDGVGLDPQNGQAAEQVVRDLRDCLGWTVE